MTLVTGEVERFEAANVLAVKFVLHGALGGGGPRSLRSDNLGKTLGAALLRMRVELPDDIVERSAPRATGAPRPPNLIPRTVRHRFGTESAPPRSGTDRAGPCPRSCGSIRADATE